MTQSLLAPIVLRLVSADCTSLPALVASGKRRQCGSRHGLRSCTRCRVDRRYFSDYTESPEGRPRQRGRLAALKTRERDGGSRHIEESRKTS